MSKGRFLLSDLIVEPNQTIFSEKLNNAIKYVDSTLYDVEVHYSCNKDLYTALLIIRERSEI